MLLVLVISIILDYLHSTNEFLYIAIIVDTALLILASPKGKMPGKIAGYFFVLAGVCLGFLLNIALSADFLIQPSITFLMALVFLTSTIFWFCFFRAKQIDAAKKIALVFLGVSVISLVSAMRNFVLLVLAWLPKYWVEEEPGGILVVKYSLIIDMLKSLLLAGLFNVLERTLKLLPKRNIVRAQKPTV